MANCYVKAYYDWIEQTAALSDAERGRLFIAILEYARSGLEPKLDGRESILFPVFQSQLDRDAKKATASAQNGRSGGRPKTKENLTKPNLTKENLTKANIRHKTEDKDIRQKTKTEDEDTSVCAESLCESDSAPPVVTLTLNDGAEYPVSEEQCHEWAGLYPAVDVIQQLRQMKAWLTANPTRRKTKRGINAFVVNWLSREQDRGARYAAARPTKPDRSGGNVFLDMLREEEADGTQ